MPLPLAFWEVDNPHQVTFYNPLPEGTQIPNREGVWAEVRVVRPTRFPMDPPVAPDCARKVVLDAFEKDRSFYLLIAWTWDDDEINLTLFRSKSGEILRYGSTQTPDWFQELDQLERQTNPTVWERLLGNDPL